MPEPRFQRRKLDRPAEIAEAALEAFAENGYAATRVDDVAKRAGVSKGLLYLYFKTKEELFKAVIRSFVVPKIEQIAIAVDKSDLGAEEFFRGPFLSFIKTLPNSRARVVVRLMIAEGPRHPDLTAFYWENVVSRGLDALRKIVARGVRNGEFRATAIEEYPQLLVSPVILALIWNLLFGEMEKLNTDRFLETHVDAMLDHLRVRADAGANS